MAKSPWQKAFTQGYACAVAEIIRSHGEDVIAWDVFAANPCKPAEIDESDREVLRKAGFFNRGAKRGSVRAALETKVVTSCDLASLFILIGTAK